MQCSLSAVSHVFRITYPSACDLFVIPFAVHVVQNVSTRLPQTVLFRSPIWCSSHFVNHFKNSFDFVLIPVARGDAVGRSTALQAQKSPVQLPIVSLEFLIDITLPHNNPAFKHDKYFLWGKGRHRCIGLTNLPPSCVDRLKIWET